jgi:rhodanese-related sulfurtransferase
MFSGVNMKRVLSLFIVSFALVSMCAFARGKAPEISAEAVQSHINGKAAKFAVLDSNDEATRASKGTVPGAIKLSSYNEYALSELPADKTTTLVFYCYNTLCPASDISAERALNAGYKDVRVMKAGIVGWLELAKKTKS